MRLLIVEDEPKTADVVRRYFERAGYVVDSARDGADGLRMAETDAYDLVILDVMLPGRPGTEILQHVRRRSRVPVILLTARVDERDRIGGLLDGADDYVTKPFSPRELVARAHAVLRRSARSGGRSPMTLCFGDLRLDPIACRALAAERDLGLTPREFGLLQALCATPNVPWTRTRLVERVFGFDYDGTERSVDTHVLNLRRKLNLPRCPTIETVFGVGYRLVVP